jgi:hypothetical protein
MMMHCTAVIKDVHPPTADNDTEEWGGVIFRYASCRAEHVLVSAIDAGSDFVDDGTLDEHLITPIVELFSVGLLTRHVMGTQASVYRVTDTARARVRAWRAS